MSSRTSLEIAVIFTTCQEIVEQWRVRERQAPARQPPPLTAEQKRAITQALAIDEATGEWTAGA